MTVLHLLRLFLDLLRCAFQLLRELSGDSAYDRYAARVGEGPRLSREEFFLDSLRRRYSRPTRCC
jgi:uncharacterized short protein YbdD (DUF466 family)